MKVCFYKPNAGTFQSREGGVQRITRIIKSELEKKGVKVLLCTTAHASNLQYAEDGFYALPSKSEDDVSNKEAFARLILQKGIDIVINQSAYSKPSLNLMDALKGKVKIVNAHHNCVRCHYGHYPFIFKSNRPKWIGNAISSLRLWPLVKALYLKTSKKQWLRAVHQGDAFVVYFDSFLQELHDLYSIQSDKVHVITNPAAFEPLPEDQLRFNKKIVYVGRIIENQKRIDKLLNLWKRLHAAFPEWSFDIVGDGPYMEKAKAFVKENKLERIAFHGFQDPEPFWMEGDIFTLTSDFEGFGMVLTEAQALGTVPVAFECFSAIHEVIDHNKSGLIIPDYDEEQMLEGVKYLIENPSVLMEFKRSGLHKVIDFDKERLASKWYRLFNKVLDHKQVHNK